MKRKYYMRGMGTGIVVTALLCAFAFSKNEPAAMTDAEIIARAQELGYTKESGVTAEDINKLKENEQLTKTPTLTPEATPEATPEPTPEPPEQPSPPGQPTPVTGDGKPTKTPTPEPTKAPTEKPTSQPVKPPSSSYTVRVERGMTATQVAGALKAAGAIADAEEFVGYLRQEKLTDSINVGTFTIPRGAGYAEIAGILTR